MFTPALTRPDLCGPLVTGLTEFRCPNRALFHYQGIYISGPGKAWRKKKEKRSSFKRSTAGLWNMDRHSQRSDCGFVSYLIHNKGVPQAQRSQSGCSHSYFMKKEDLSWWILEISKVSNAPARLICKLIRVMFKLQYSWLGQFEWFTASSLQELSWSMQRRIPYQLGKSKLQFFLAQTYTSTPNFNCIQDKWGNPCKNRRINTRPWQRSVTNVTVVNTCSLIKWMCVSVSRLVLVLPLIG